MDARLNEDQRIAAIIIAILHVGHMITQQLYHAQNPADDYNFPSDVEFRDAAVDIMGQAEDV